MDKNLKKYFMSNFERNRCNPVELMKKYGFNQLDHITFDPELKKGDYSINRQIGHDGTYFFTYNMLIEALGSLAMMQSYWKPMGEPPYDKLIRIEYTVGEMTHVIAYGRVDLKCGGNYPGQTERIRIPVKCRYIYQDENNRQPSAFDPPPQETPPPPKSDYQTYRGKEFIPVIGKNH